MSTASLTRGRGLVMANGYPGALRRNLVAYWPLDEASGTRRDAFGGNTLTDNNTVTGGTGPSGNLPLASQFTEANSETLSIADNAALSLEGTSWSLMAWVYMDAIANNNGIVAKDANSAGNREFYLRYLQASGRFVMILLDSTTAILSVTAGTYGAVPATTWLQVMFTYDHPSRTGTLSVNAGLRDSAVGTGDITASGAAFAIGRDFGSGYMDGRICNVALWKRVITRQEEAWLYNAGQGRAWPWR